MRMIVIGVAAAILAGTGFTQSPTARAAEVALPSWLTGCWIEQKGTAWTEECWTSARGGMLIGSGRTGDGDRLRSWETMQILREAPGLAFYGAPGGVGRTRFAMRADGQGVTFVNPGHDYPQRIRYWREGDLLLAEASLADGTRAKRWKFKRN